MLNQALLIAQAADLKGQVGSIASDRAVIVVQRPTDAGQNQALVSASGLHNLATTRVAEIGNS